MNNTARRPKIALAFSGGSGRAMAQAGVLEVFREQGIPVDIITACSSGSLIAASYASGTLDRLRQDWLGMNRDSVYRMFALNEKMGGLFAMNKFTQWFDGYCLQKNMEEFSPKLGFVAVDLEAKALVLLCMGELKRSLQASCAVPGLFEPVRWGNKLLVDGGLMSFIPAREAREMGADVVIGVNVLHRRTMFTKRTLDMWRRYSRIKNSVWFRPMRYALFRLDGLYKKTFAGLFSEDYDFFKKSELPKNLHVFEVLKRSMDIAIDQDTENMRTPEGCDVLLRPDGIYLDQIGVKQTQMIYDAGRACALEAIPEIKRLIAEFNGHKSG